ncbi:MAG: SPOR domain-containing protein [Gammaproteobacteria bacterium]|nr:SPOR domain-containing protein [Gammaproteobacteria bacterium]MDH5651907.1 SPOR domain-containing protein [Gammaproteobacteria bacterium]
MPRDYAKNKSDNNGKKTGIPGWIWMLGGLTVGLFVAFLVYLNENTPKHKQRLLTDAMKRTVEDARKVQEQKQNLKEGDKRPRFDFYTILPELEVAIPEQELVKPKHTTPKPGPNNKPGKPEEFSLQTGSFRHKAEADKLKAKLALQGIVTNIQTVTINDGDTWHRVRVGPMTNAKELDAIRIRLQKLGISTMVVKSKN